MVSGKGIFLDFQALEIPEFLNSLRKTSSAQIELDKTQCILHLRRSLYGKNLSKNIGPKNKVSICFRNGNT